MKRCVVVGICLAWGAVAFGYLPPVEEKGGIVVSIESFPQTIAPFEAGKDPYARPVGVTEVAAGAPRAFPVVVSNTTDRAVAGRVKVWMNDDWTVTGPNGPLSLAPHTGRTLTFTGAAGERALDALYQVHATFTPDGASGEAEVPHPIAIFRYVNPNAPRALPTPEPPTLGPGVFRLDRAFARTVTLAVNGVTTAVGEDGAAPDWGAWMAPAELNVGGVVKQGYRTHPPYKKGAGVIWSDYPLTLPDVTPIRLKVSNFLVSNWDQPPSDGVEYKVFVDGKEIAAQTVAKILTWQDLTADLSAYAGKRITLRLWTGPGPKMNTCCDGGGWGDLRLEIGPQPPVPTESDWTARAAKAAALAKAAVTAGTDAKAGRYRLADDDGLGVYGAGVVRGACGLEDGVIAFSDGTRTVSFRGFTAMVETANGSSAPRAKAEVFAERGALRIRWSLPGVTPDAQGFPRITDLALGAASERPLRVYAGFGNVIAGPKKFTMSASGFALSTRHVAADYDGGLSVLQAVDVPPDAVASDGERNVWALRAHHNATFSFVPSAKGAFAAGRRFRSVSGYRTSPGHDRLGARMCLDQWGGDFAKAAADLRKAAHYGVTDAIFVKHDWQRWGYDYRLPEIYPPRGDAAAFGEMRKACAETGILFCPHDNYTDIYPDCEGFSYDLVVFNLDGTPQKAWFNSWRTALSYRWAPHAFRPWCLRNAKLLKAGFDPDGVFIDVFTAHGPFDYLDRAGRFHTKMETSRRWAEGYGAYREGFGRADAVCVSEAGQDHLVGMLDAGQSDHFGAGKLVGLQNFDDFERTPWHDIVTHNRFVLFAGGLGGRYQEEAGWRTGGDPEKHGYASDDYLSNAILGGRNPMCAGPFSRKAVKTYWLHHDISSDLGKAEFLDLTYEGGDIHHPHSVFSGGGEVWVNRRTNEVWRLPNGVVLPPYGHWAKTSGNECGVIVKDGATVAYAKGKTANFYEARGNSVQFYGVKTDGAFQLERTGDAWRILPLPESKPFTVELDLAALGAKGAVVKSVATEDPGAEPDWRQEGNRFTLCVSENYGIISLVFNHKQGDK